MVRWKEPLSIEGSLRPGWYLYWEHHIYRILSCDVEHSLSMYIEDVSNHEGREIRVEELLYVRNNDEKVPIYAPTLEALRQEIDARYALPEPAPASGIPEQLLRRAKVIIDVVETVEQILLEHDSRAKLQGLAYAKSMVLQQACTSLEEPIGLTTYYDYRKRYRKYHGDQVQIAASLHRKTWSHTRMNQSQLHFIDAIILRYYGRDRPTRPLLLYRIAYSALKLRTDSLWIDPKKCGKQIPQDLIEELLDTRIPIQAILNNSEKACLLTPITMPSLGWFYQYLRWFEAQPNQGRQVLTERYGKEAWEKVYLVFDTFVTKATLPLQYVFADHYLLDVFIVDEATRSKLDRLWLTVLIDAYSRCIVGMVLLYEEPCIESIQNALLHAIWPKQSHKARKVEGEWICYGIPQQLYLDNAWAHHSHSLEHLARAIGHGGKYNSINLVFRTPYKARYGALIERFFGNLSNHIKQLLPGAIQSHDPKDIQDAAKKACLLYEDIDCFLHKMILEYQHTSHNGLGSMTPHQKWIEGMHGGLPSVPPLTERTRRFFLRMSPETRLISSKGISVFGLHYNSSVLSTAERVDKDGKDVEYSFRYDPVNISSIALFRGEHWAGDIYAKELQHADGTFKSTSLWEVKRAKELAKENQGTRNWLAYVNDADVLTKKRKAEKRQANRRPKASPSAKPLSADKQERSIPNTAQENTVKVEKHDGYTQLLADFQS